MTSTALRWLRRAPLILCLSALVLQTPLPARAQVLNLVTQDARPDWKSDIDRLAEDGRVGIAVRLDERILFGRNERVARVPASNQKLLLSMAALDLLGPDHTFPTFAAGHVGPRGIIGGNLWLYGRGDPALSGGLWGRLLPFRPTSLGKLARLVADAGVVRVRGSVVGARNYFARDWWAEGWRDYYRTYHVGLPAGLSFDGNIHKGRYTRWPEHIAAAAFTKKLEALGVKVGGPAHSDPAPPMPPRIASVRSVPLETLLRYTNRTSSNLFAELLGKRLGLARFGTPGTIAKGARAIEAWAATHGHTVEAHDSSGLSFANRVSPHALVGLLEAAEDETWGPLLRRGLAAPGEGTLDDRLDGVIVRAKTGTLDGVSALSGWVWLEQEEAWASFSIISRGMSKSDAVKMEDAIVRILARRAHLGTSAL